MHALGEHTQYARARRAHRRGVRLGFGTHHSGNCSPLASWPSRSPKSSCGSCGGSCGPATADGNCGAVSPTLSKIPLTFRRRPGILDAVPKNTTSTSSSGAVVAVAAAVEVVGCSCGCAWEDGALAAGKPPPPLPSPSPLLPFAPPARDSADRNGDPSLEQAAVRPAERRSTQNPVGHVRQDRIATIASCGRSIRSSDEIPSKSARKPAN
jgi:hypothetical protein